MAARDHGSYHAVSQTSGRRRPWWQRVPQPIANAAVNAWSLLPQAVRRPFIPIGRWINPHQTMLAASGQRPDTVDGVAELRAQGFEPIEEHTGAIEVARLWPDEHRRWVKETRAEWLDDTNYDGRLWLVRSPWPSLDLRDALNVLWSWTERDRPRLTTELWRERVSEALAWDDATAAEWHRQIPR